MENTIYEIKDTQANTLAINCAGNYAVLGGRRELLLINLNNFQERKKVSLQTKWETSAAQWNPSDPTRFATARNNRGDLYTWVDGKLSYAGNLKGHVRSISSIDWCPHDVHRLATSSVDSFRAICIWDTRMETKKPVNCFESVSGASNFRWNRVSDTIFATAHESDVRLWDTRKGTMPVHYVAAHVMKVWDIDWCPNDSSEFVTCSQDCKIKLWSTKDLKCPNYEASSNGIPLFRARYTPFGRGLVTTPTPYRRQDDVVLVLWSIYSDGLNALMPITGHIDVVLGFEWRQNSDGDHELLTWSRDQNLRVCRPTPDTLINCGVTLAEDDKTFLDISDSKLDGEIEQNYDRLVGEYENHSQDVTVTSLSGESSTSPKPIKKETQLRRTEVIKSKEEQGLASSGSLTPSGSVDVSVTPISTGKLSEQGNTDHMTIRTDSSTNQISSLPDMYIPLMKRSPSASKSLQQEVSLLSSNPQYELEEMDYMSRRGCLRINSGSLQVRLQVTFTERYPADRLPPVFHFLNATMKLSEIQIDELLKILQETSTEAMQFSRNCLEPCIRRVIPLLESWQKENHFDVMQRESGGNSISQNSFPAFIQPSDIHVPAPRTSGARITPGGCLLCFKSPNKFELSGLTPRSLYDVAARCSSNNILPSLDHMMTNRISPPGDSHNPTSIKRRTHKNSVSSSTRRRSPAVINNLQRSKSHCLTSPSINSYNNASKTREDAAEGKNSSSHGDHQLKEGTKVPSDPNVYWTASLSAKQNEEELLTNHQHQFNKNDDNESLVQSKESKEPLNVIAANTTTSDLTSFTPQRQSHSSAAPPQMYGQFYGSINHRPLISASLTSPKSGNTANTNGHKRRLSRCVYLYDISQLMLPKRQLAQDYVIIPDDISLMCSKNAETAATSGRKDLTQFWQYCQILSDPKLAPVNEPSVLPPWATMPFGRSMINSWIEHFSQYSDIQSLAMLAMVAISVDLKWNQGRSVAYIKGNQQPSRGFSSHVSNSLNSYYEEDQSQKYQQAHTADNKYPKHTLQNIREVNARPHSLSCLNIFEDDLAVTDANPVDVGRKAHFENMKLIDTALLYRLSHYIRCYGNLLYAWQLIVTRAQMLCLLPVTSAGPSSGFAEDSGCSVQLQVRCHRCHADSTVGSDACCSQCHSGGPLLTCALCNLSVRGLATLCPHCHHGGHTDHIAQWFSVRKICPTGCGCHCLSLISQITGLSSQTAFSSVNSSQEASTGRFHAMPTKNVY